MSEVRGDGHQEGSQRVADQDSILEASLLLRLRDARASALRASQVSPTEVNVVGRR